MMSFALLFELNCKVTDVQFLYIFFISLGLFGLVLGFWRWWLSAFWLVLISTVVLIQIREIYYLYGTMIGNFGESYVWHIYISMVFGATLNLYGIFKNFPKNKKIKFQ